MAKMIIDMSYNFYIDARGGDPDNTSLMLKGKLPLSIF